MAKQPTAAQAQSEVDRLLKIQAEKARINAVPVVTLEDEIQQAQAKLFEAQEAERQAALILLRAAEARHEIAILKAVEALAAKVEKLLVTGEKILAQKGDPHARIIGPVMSMPQILKFQGNTLQQIRYVEQKEFPDGKLLSYPARLDASATGGHSRAARQIGKE